MILLALEASSPVESAALLDGGRVIASRSWPGDRVHARPLFDSLRAMTTEAGFAPERIGAYAVGLGPGSFAGLRMALACAQGMALPGDRPVFGLASAEAAAWEASGETGVGRVFVCGDGRRGRIWRGCFQKGDDGMRLEDDWRLDPLDDLPRLVPAGALVCSPDWDRFAAPLKAAAAAGGFRLLERAACPSAETVGRLASLKMERGVPSLPLSPIYLHPPVFVPPSFIEKDESPSQEKA